MGFFHNFLSNTLHSFMLFPFGLLFKSVKVKQQKDEKNNEGTSTITITITK